MRFFPMNVILATLAIATGGSHAKILRGTATDNSAAAEEMYPAQALSPIVTDDDGIKASSDLIVNKRRKCKKHHLKYGDVIYLQSRGFSSRWLSGARDVGNEGVLVRDARKNNYERIQASKTYKWTIQSDPKRTWETDPQHGKCLKYGDLFSLRNEFLRDRWLTGGRGSGNTAVMSRNMFQNAYEQITAKHTYMWRARSNAGVDQDTDPALDEYIEKDSGVYLQNPQINYNRWLTGSRNVGNEGVRTDNMHKNSYEQTGIVGLSYVWMFKTELGDPNGADGAK